MQGPHTEQHADGDYSALASLRSLTTLSIGNISDLSPLAGLGALRSLNLSGNDVLTDLTPLSTVPFLARVRLFEDSSLSSIEALADLRSLHHVVICQTPIDDLSPLVQNPDFGAGDSLIFRDVTLDDAPPPYDAVYAELSARGVSIDACEDTD